MCGWFSSARCERGVCGVVVVGGGYRGRPILNSLSVIAEDRNGTSDGSVVAIAVAVPLSLLGLLLATIVVR